MQRERFAFRLLFPKSEQEKAPLRAHHQTKWQQKKRGGREALEFLSPLISRGWNTRSEVLRMKVKWFHPLSFGSIYAPRYRRQNENVKLKGDRCLVRERKLHGIFIIDRKKFPLTCVACTSTRLRRGVVSIGPTSKNKPHALVEPFYTFRFAINRTLLPFAAFFPNITPFCDWWRTAKMRYARGSVGGTRTRKTERCWKARLPEGGWRHL